MSLFKVLVLSSHLFGNLQNNYLYLIILILLVLSHCVLSYHHTMEHVEANEDFIMMRGSANRSLNEAHTKRKNIFSVVPECGPCSTYIFHWSCSETYSIGDLLEVNLKDEKVYAGEFRDGECLNRIL